MKKRVHLLFCFIFFLASPTGEAYDRAEHQHTFAHTQMFVFKGVFSMGLLEKAEIWSFLMGKLCVFIRTEELIPSEHSVWQQSHRGCVYADSHCCHVSYC